MEPEDTTEEVKSAPEKETETQEATSQSFGRFRLESRTVMIIEQVATEVASHVQTIVDDMDAEGTLQATTIAAPSIFKLTPRTGRYYRLSWQSFEGLATIGSKLSL